MNISHSHLVVRDILPPVTGPEIVGHLYGITPSFKTIIPDYAVEAESEVDEDEEAVVETKVVRRGRRPRAANANEQAETK